MSRRWRIILIAVPGVLIALGVGGCVYLNSAATARQIAGSLRDSLGAPVEIEDVSVGLGRTTLKRLQVFEPGSENPEPWLTVEKAEVGLSLLKALFGDRQPNELVLHGARVVLRLDRDGNLVSRFTLEEGGGGRTQLPPIRVENSELVLRREGEPERTFRGVSATLTPGGDELQIQGAIADPAWGEWTLGGTVSSATGAGQAWLRSKGVQPVTPEYLKAIPFVPASAWREVIITGRTPARAEFAFAPGKPFHYAVEMEPVDADVTVTSIDLRATDAAGKVTVEDDVVRLRGVTGRTADGTLAVDGDLDFRGDDSVLRFRIHANRLDVQKLPEDWGLPNKIAGFLSGNADLTLRVTDQGTKTSGEGKAVITDVKLGPLDADAIVLTLHPSSKGYRFKRDASKAPAPKEDVKESAPPEKVGLDPRATALVTSLLLTGDPAGLVAQKDKDPAPEKKGAPRQAEPAPRGAGGFTSMVLKWIAWLVKPAAAEQEERSYLTINLGLTDVNVAEALKQLDIKLPVGLAGRVTLRLEADVPTDTPNDFKTYRLRGSVSSKRLEVEGVPFEDLAARVDVRNLILRLEEFSGRLVGGANVGKAGTFKGTGDMRLAEAYPFRAKLDLSGIDAGVTERLGDLLPFPVRGVLNADAAVEGTLSPVNVRGNAAVKATGLRVGVLPLNELTFNAAFEGERVRIDGVKAALLGGEATASAVIPLRDDADGKATVTLKGVDLGELTKQFPPGVKVRIEGDASGTLNATIPPRRGDEPRRISAEIDLQAPKLRFQNIPAERIKGAAVLSNGRLQYKLTGAALGGTFEVDGQYPPAPKAAPRDGPTGNLSVEGVRLSALRRELKLPEAIAPLRGLASLELRYRVEDGALTGVGSLRVDRVRWGDREVVPRLRAIVRLTENQLRLEGLSAPLGQGEARGLAVIDLENLDRSRLILNLRQVPAETLLAVAPGVGDALGGRVDATVRTTLGRQLRGNATLSLATGTVAGVPARDLRIPLEWSFTPGRGGGEVQVRDFSGTVAQGRVTGRATLTYFADLPPRVNGHVQFSNLNLQSLSSATESVTGANQVTGRFDFQSERFRSASDLNGTLNATLGETRPFQLPVLSDILPFLGGGRSNLSTARRGEVRATLSSGTFRVQRFALTGNSLDLFGEGTVTVDGRLNLRVTASTRALPIDPLALRIFGIRIPTELGPLPVTLIFEVSRYLSNRVVHLQVTGTFRDPSVRVRAFETLSEAAVRYFLERSLGPAAAVTGAAASNNR